MLVQPMLVRPMGNGLTTNILYVQRSMLFAVYSQCSTFDTGVCFPHLLFRSMYIILHKCYNWKLLKLPVIWSRIPYANLLLASMKLRALQDVFYHVSTVNSAVS